MKKVTGQNLPPEPEWCVSIEVDGDPFSEEFGCLPSVTPTAYNLIVDSGEAANGDRVEIRVECTAGNVSNGLNLLADLYAKRTGVRLG